MLIKDKVFILKKLRYGEADLILQTLNPQGARLSLFARAALKSRKRFGGGVLEPTHYVHVMYDDRRQKTDQGGLSPLREANLIEGFEALRADYSRLQAALLFLQLVADVSREGDVGSSELFNLLGNSLRAAITSSDLVKLAIHFEAKLLALQGMLLHEGDEALLLQTPISDHETAPLGPEQWRDAGARVRRALSEYLGDRAPARF